MNQGGITPESLAWALGIAGSMLGAALVFTWNWLHKVSDEAKAASRAADQLKSHVAENYVRGHEIAEVKRIISDLRVEMSNQIMELRREVTQQLGDLTKALLQGNK